MKTRTPARQKPPVMMIAACAVLAILGLVQFSGAAKVLTLVMGLAALYLLFTRDLTSLRTAPGILLLLYVVVSGLTGFWALSGKFFLSEFSKIFVACVLFLWIMLAKRFDAEHVRRLMTVLAGVSAIYAALSVEAASTGLLAALLKTLIPGMASVEMGFESGTRLTGIFGNANTSASILALGILFSICLLVEEKEQGRRMVYAGLLSLNAFVFLLSFSMGGTACFAAAIVVYLIFAGEQRTASLIRMLEGSVPTLAWVFAAFPFFNRGGAAAVVPLIAMIGNLASVVVLERYMANRVIAALESRAKLAVGVLVGVIALGAVYIVLGMNLTGAYTFGGGTLERGAYPAPGEHTLSVQTTGEVRVSIVSQNMSQVMMHTNTVLYQGSAQNAAFTVPEDSEVCYFTFTAESGTVLSEVKIDGTDALKLKYTLLPGFIANRLQGLRANQNAIQRTVFFRDGMKMFYQKPFTGNGVGSFETGITSVQEFYYETKYIHNHYIQVLLEAGLIGFVPFVGALCAMVWVLWSKRREEQWQFRGAYPALWASLAMIMAHAAVEVSMSMSVFLCYAFVTFGLITRCCARPRAVEAASGKKGRKAKTSGREWAVKAVCMVFPAVFLVTLCMNMAAYQISRSPVASNAEFFTHLKTAAELDPYEANDAKLTYVELVRREEDDSRIDQANQFAAELMRVQSNSIPKTLVNYYLATGQYQQAIQAAKASAAYSASDPDTWNDILEMFREVLLNGIFSPLMENVDVLADGLMEYCQMLQDHNAASMEDIQLTQENQEFLEKMQAVAASDRSADCVLSIILA